MPLVRGLFQRREPQGNPDIGAPTTPAITTALVSNLPVVTLTTPSTDDYEVRGYQLERKVAAGSFGLLAGSAVFPYTDATASAPNTLYTYRIRAYDSLQFSAYSNEDSETTANVLGPDVTAPNTGTTPTLVTKDYQSYTVSFPIVADPAPGGAIQSGMRRYSIQIAGAHAAYVPHPAGTGVLTYSNIGTVGAPGSDNGSTFVSGGSYHYGTVDNMNMNWESRTGDFSVVMVITGISSSYRWAKAGYEFRVSLLPDSAYVFFGGFQDDGLNDEYRLTSGGDAGQGTRHTAYTYPYLLRGTRRGEKIILERSQNTVTPSYTTHDTITIPGLPDTILFGRSGSQQQPTGQVTMTFTGYAVTAATTLYYSGVGAASTAYAVSYKGEDNAGNLGAAPTALTVTLDAAPGGAFAHALWPRTCAMHFAALQLNDSAEYALHARFDTSINQWYIGWAANNGVSIETAYAAIRAINPRHQPWLYFNCIEADDSGNAISDHVNAFNQWAYKNGTSGTRQELWPTKFLTMSNQFCPVDGSGYRLYEWFARTYIIPELTAAPSVQGPLLDNCLWKPRYDMDWNRDGSTDSQDNATVQGWLRAEIKHLFDVVRVTHPTRMMSGNCDCINATQAGSELNGYMDSSLMEGMLGYFWSPETWGGFAEMVSEYQGRMATLNANKIGFFGAVLTSATAYQEARYAMGCCYCMGDAYVAITPEPGEDYSVTPLYDEYDLGVPQAKPLGNQVDGPQTTPYQLGAYMRRFQFGAWLVNPKGNGARTITLPTGVYKHISGSQAPSVNSGANADTVTLQDRDGIMLLLR